MQCKIEIRNFSKPMNAYTDLSANKPINDVWNRADRLANENNRPVKLLLKAAGKGDKAPKIGNWFLQGRSNNPLTKGMPTKGWWQQKGYGEGEH